MSGETCPAALSVKGEHFNCDLTGPHPGLAHSSRGAEAIWTADRYELGREAEGYGEDR